MPPIPYGSIVITAGASSPLAVVATSTAGLLSGWTSNGQYSSFSDSDQSVQPDYANNRVLVHKPGVYKISFSAQVQADGEQAAEFALYVNGAPVSPAVSAPITFADSRMKQVHFQTIYNSPAPAAGGSVTDSVQIYLLSDDINGNSQDLSIVGATLLVERIG